MASVASSYDDYFSEITLKPSDGGRFEVRVNDKTLFSKLDENRFPEDEEVMELVGKEIGAA